MPPPVVIPPMPTEPVSPKPVASPISAAAVVYAPVVSPLPAQAVLAASSISRPSRSRTSMTMPPSIVPWAAPLWPPERTASSSPCSRARAMTAATSSVSATRTITAGRTSTPPSMIVRCSS